TPPPLPRGPPPTRSVVEAAHRRVHARDDRHDLVDTRDHDQAVVLLLAFVHHHPHTYVAFLPVGRDQHPNPSCITTNHLGQVHHDPPWGTGEQHVVEHVGQRRRGDRIQLPRRSDDDDVVLTTHRDV